MKPELCWDRSLLFHLHLPPRPLLIRDRKEVGLGWRWGKSKLADARTGRPHLIFFSHLLPVGRVIIHKGKDRRGAQLLEKEKKITREVKTQDESGP